MLSQLEPWELVEMWAAKEAVPLDDGWRQAGTIAAAVHNEFERYCAGKAGKTEVDEDRLHNPTHYIPRLRFKKPPKIKVNQRSIDLTQSLIASHYGY